MSTIRVSTALAVIAAMALSVLPVQAQEDRGSAGDRPRAERRRPRGDGDGQRNEGRRAQADGGRREAPRAQRAPGHENRDTDRDRNIARDRRAAPRGNSRDGWRNDRGRDVSRYQPAPRVHRTYSRPSRVRVVPYGYRPRGYSRGWNGNLYFGRPYSYGRPGYYGGSGYGYYALPSGFAYGSLRIVDAPRYAPVFVDGYYAGEVDDYDGIFQRLNLEPGRHLVEIDVYPGAPPLEYDVFVEPGRTVTIHVR